MRICNPILSLENRGPIKKIDMEVEKWEGMLAVSLLKLTHMRSVQ
jgi:hypothetical protein